MSSSRSEFIAGIKAILPILLGIIPFGMIAGITAINAGISKILAIVMCIIVFAGTSQLAIAGLLAISAPAAIIIFTAFVINSRFAMYSASIAPHFKESSMKLKLLLSYLLTDQAYAVSIIHFNNYPESKHKESFFLGAGVMMWLTWQISNIAGILLGAKAPSSWSLDFAVPLVFIALSVPAIKDRAAAVAAISSGITALLCVKLPYNLYIIAAAVVGITAGVLVEMFKKKERLNHE